MILRDFESSTMVQRLFLWMMYRLNQPNATSTDLSDCMMIDIVVWLRGLLLDAF